MPPNKPMHMAGQVQYIISLPEEIKEIPAEQRYITRPPLDAHVRYGYTLKEIAEYSKVHYFTISRMINKFENGQLSTRNRK